MVRENEISSQFGFEIYGMSPKKGIYYLRTSKGEKCLKKISYGPQKLLYIYKAKEHVINNGFKRIDQNMLTPEGTPYALVNDDVYVVTQWIDGRECDFHNEEELKIAARTLGKFHQSARNFKYEEGVRVRNDIGRLPGTMEKRMYNLNKMRSMARKNKRKTEFDMLYLTNVDFYVKLAQEALSYMDMEGYYKVCNLAISDDVLCHHDYTYHNILIDKNNEGYIIDFDYCKSEIQVYDVTTLLIKSLKRLEWSVESMQQVISAYESVRPISKDEFSVICTLLKFPQRFWRLANRYYYKQENWGEDTFIKKLKEILDEREQFMNCVNSFDKIVF